MNSTAFIRQTLEASKGWALGLLMDLQDAPLAQPTAHGGNHALWILGHLVYSESTLLDSFIHGKPNRFEEWAPIFGIKSVPISNADDYPSFQKVLENFEVIRSDVLAYLGTLSEDDLDAKSHAPEEFGAGFGTVGGCFTAMSTHVSFHAGQAAVVRKSLGRDPLMA